MSFNLSILKKGAPFLWIQKKAVSKTSGQFVVTSEIGRNQPQFGPRCWSVDFWFSIFWALKNRTSKWLCFAHAKLVVKMAESTLLSFFWCSQPVQRKFWRAGCNFLGLENILEQCSGKCRACICTWPEGNFWQIWLAQLPQEGVNSNLGEHMCNGANGGKLSWITLADNVSNWWYVWVISLHIISHHVITSCHMSMSEDFNIRAGSLYLQ